MTITSPLVDFAIYDPAIKQDSTISIAFSDFQPFSKPADLEIPGDVQIYGSFEPDFWVLDGRYKLMPTDTTNVHVGWVSSTMSGADRISSAPPDLWVVFSEAHDIDGLTLKFSSSTNDWCDWLAILYYDSSDNLIRQDTHFPTGPEFYTAQAVVGVRSIDIILIQTNKPFRYFRTLSIDYGQVIHLAGTDIKSCTVVEETDPLSIILPIGTMELTVFSNEAAFSIINPTGVYSELVNKQTMDVYELVDNDIVYIGHFYLDTWENVSDNEILFRCIDTIGLMDTIPYMGGRWGLDVLLTTVLDAMFSGIGIPYKIDPYFSGHGIEGVLPVCSCREALQQIAFSYMASISGRTLAVVCSRSGVVHLKTVFLADRLSNFFDYSITAAEKGTSSKVTLKPLVTGVEVVAHSYYTAANTTELVNESMPVGLRTIVFRNPVDNLTLIVSGATILSSGTNFAVLNVVSSGIVTLNGNEFESTKTITGKYATGLSSSVKPNIVRIEDALLNTSNPTNAQNHANLLYDYFQQRYIQNMKLFSPALSVSDSVLIDTLCNRRIGAIVEKMTLDLANGFTAQVEATGVVISL